MAKTEDKPEAKAKEPTMAERVEALESAVHGLQVKHGNQQKQIDSLNEVNELRLRSRGLIG